MKTTNWQLCRTGIALLILLSHQLTAQVREPFNELNLTAVTSHFFYPQTFKDIPVPDPYSYDDTINANKALSLFSYFDKACLDEHAYIDDFSEFHRSMIRQAHADNFIPIAILDINYHDFIEGGLSNDFFSYDGTKLHDSPDQSINPYKQKEAFVAWCGSDIYENRMINFKLPSEFYVSNKSSAPESIKIDFDDGLGFRNVQFDTPVSVDYREGTQNRTIRISLKHNDNTEVQSAVTIAFAIDFMPCETTNFPFPNQAPWPTDTSVFNDWMVSTSYENQTIMADAFTLTSDDGIFDKPFIFVEGVDFGRDNNMLPIHLEYQNGTFGWCQFTSGFLDPDLYDDQEYGYDMLHRMPDFLHTIREYGYDIVLIDFYDGAELMQKNAAIVEHILNLCNDYKVGKEPLVVAGASMGGQITRYALRDMEINNGDPCTRLWISLDSPHAGAYIPAALQEAIKFGADHGVASAANTLEYFLHANAARQLLNYQINDDQIVRNAWYSQIDEMGYPRTCRTLGISNGLGNGMGLQSDHPRLMDWSCNLGITEVPKEFLYPISGDLSQPYNGGYVFGHYKMFVTGWAAAASAEWYDYVGGLFTDWAIIANFVDIEERKKRSFPGQYNWDYAPGGIRGSIKAFADAINNSLDELPINGVCHVETGDYYKNHCFIPATSSIGISGIDPYVNLEQFLLDHPEHKHFDRIIFAQTQNEAHSEVTSYNLSVILDELLGFELSGLGSELTANSPNNGTFNFGKQELTTLRDIHIHDGGHLFINRSLPTHFASNTDVTVDHLFFEVTTHSCSSAEVLIDQGGSLEIGDPDVPGRKANLILNRDSRIIVGTNGELKIFKDSKLIINEGAELIIHPGALVLVDNGSIVVNEGGKIIMKEGDNPGAVNDITLLNDNSNILIDGGQIQIENNTEFTITHEGANSGYIQVMEGSNDVLLNGENSVFSLNGDNIEDVMLIVANHAIFENVNFQQGEIHLSNCKVDLSGYGIIKTNMKVIADQVKFYSVGQATNLENSMLWIQNNNSVFSNSIFYFVRLKNQYGFCKANQCSFTNILPGLQCSGGGYNIKNSTFDGSSIESSSLQNVSAVSDCNFFSAFANKIKDISLVELKVNHCYFDNEIYYPSIEKTGGKLSVFCSEFDSQIGIRMENGELNLSGVDMAGYNDFSHSQTCINLVNASGIKLYKGHNDFSGVHYHAITGSMNIPCIPSTGCNIYLNAQNNYWGLYPANTLQPSGSNLRIPENSNFNVHTAAYGPCSGPEGPQWCSIHFKDMAPALPTACPALRPLEVKSSVLSNENNSERASNIDRHGMLKNDVQNEDTPTINTIHFENVSLDSALIYSAMQMEVYDSLGNDEFAIELFYEILMDSLDQTNQEIKRKMNWGRYNMKTALETMFIQQELSSENNSVSFETPVQLYVDVLNLMTETNLTDSTYRMQFYLELDKGQFFRTLNKLPIAQQIFAHLDECQLDSLEQTILNDWRQQTDEDLSFIHQSIVLDLPIDSINTSVDTSNYSVPMTLEVSDYYFGLWIDSPNSITFVSCGEDPVYRWAEHEKNSAYLVYPNPATDRIKIKNISDSKTNYVQIHDLTGKCIFSTEVSDSIRQQEIEIILPNAISAGSYVIRIKSDLLTEDHPIVLIR